ncbi:hypothetical protein SUNI508_10606 [Seiridium unicorne]|uniref:Uncharacterized protein n=1 Tax=Seiridium unicorne TaxID=138068 RepID=A0ABR2UKW4_9PEZI
MVVKQVLSNMWVVDDKHVNSMLPKLLGWPDATQHKQLRAFEHTLGKNDFPRRRGSSRALDLVGGFDTVGNANHLAIVDVLEPRNGARWSSEREDLARCSPKSSHPSRFSEGQMETGFGDFSSARQWWTRLRPIKVIALLSANAAFSASLTQTEKYRFKMDTASGFNQQQTFD